MQIYIRKATESDIPRMHEIRMNVVENRLSHLSRVQPAHYVPFVRDGRHAWVAEVGGTIAGFAIGDDRTFSVWALFVDPEQEGRGIGKQLHDVMVDGLFDAGAAELSLSTDPHTRAEEFYRRAGWTSQGSDAGGETRFRITRERWISLKNKG